MEDPLSQWILDHSEEAQNNLLHNAVHMILKSLESTDDEERQKWRSRARQAMDFSERVERESSAYRWEKECACLKSS